MQKNRNLSLDIIRTVAVIFTISVHFVTNSGFLGIQMQGAGSFAMLLVWLLSKTCVPLFLMLSGYLCLNRKLSLSYYLGIVRIMVIYVFTAVICLLFEHFVRGQEMGLRYIFGSIVNFYAGEYGWYVSLYLGLFIMMPFLNAMYHGLETQGKKLALLVSFFAVSMLPSLLNTYIQLYSLWWDKLWPITLYFTGAYLREYKPKLGSAKLGLLLCAVLLGFAGFDVVLFKGNGALANTIDYAHYQNYFISLLTFAFMLKLPVDKISPAVGKAFAKISELSFAIYLLSSVSDGAIYPRFAQLVPEYTDRYIWLPVMVGLSFIIALVLAWLSSFVYEPVIRIIKGFFEKRIKE